MKKFLAIILSVAMMFSSIIFAAYAVDDTDSVSTEDTSDENEYNYKKILTLAPSLNWLDYNSYIDYSEDNDSGYLIEEVLIAVSSDFSNSGMELDASMFPKIENKILKIKHDTYTPVGYTMEFEYFIRFDWGKNDGEFLTSYTAEMIDEFISMVKYLTTFSFVEAVCLEYSSKATFGDPIIDPVDTDLEPEDDVTTEPDTTEALGAVTESDDTDKSGLNNPATGDRFFIYMSVLLLSAGVTFVITAAVTKRKVKK